MKILVLGIFLFSLTSLGECKSNYIIKQEQYMPLYMLIGENKIDEAMKYISDNNVPLNTIIAPPHSIIAVAAHFCRPRLVNDLLNHGVSLDNEQSSHLIYTALEVGCVRVFWYLVGKGFPLKFEDDRGANLLFAAVNASALTDNGAGLTEFKFLIDKGLDYRVRTKTGLSFYCLIVSYEKEKSTSKNILQIKEFMEKNHAVEKCRPKKYKN